MKKTFWRTFILCVLLSTLFYSQALSSEDTAKLTLRKTAIPKKNFQPYTVQEGDVLSAIIRKIPGITQKDIPLYYRITKELNPDITNMNRLYVGQTIKLPGKSITMPEEKTTTPVPAVNTLPSGTSGHQTYQVKKGDNLIQITHRELHIINNTQKTLLTIKSLNPDIKNAHKIFTGQMIRLPEAQIAPKAVEVDTEPNKRILISEQKPTQPVKIVGEKVPVVSPQEQSLIQEKMVGEVRRSIILPPAARLAVIKHILAQMNGSIITNGNYYLPVSRTEQLTIDCSIIPVVELEDRTTIFLDMQNRSNNHLENIISDHWSNYHLVKIDDQDDIIIILKKIFKNTNTYEITRAQNPFSLGSHPVLEVMVDWVIAKKDAKKSSSKIQGLRFVYENKDLLPKAIVNYARQHSLIITEISPEKGLVGKPEEIYSLPSMTILPTSSAKDFSRALLSYLNIPGETDADVRVFNIAEDGFNLSIKTDTVVTRGGKKTILFSRNLPPQFINILQKAGNELIFVFDQDEPAKNMEKILRGFNFLFTSGYFTFSGLDKNQSHYHFGFSGTKIKTEKDIYIVNFDFNQELRGLMQKTWSANIVRYGAYKE